MTIIRSLIKVLMIGLSFSYCASFANAYPLVTANYAFTASGFYDSQNASTMAPQDPVSGTFGISYDPSLGGNGATLSFINLQIDGHTYTTSDTSLLAYVSGSDGEIQIEGGHIGGGNDGFSIFAASGVQDIAYTTASIASSGTFYAGGSPNTEIPLNPAVPAGNLSSMYLTRLPDLSASVVSEFTSIVSNSWVGPGVTGNRIGANFVPDIGSLGDLNELAQLGGFDHFNVEQVITSISGTTLSSDLIASLVGRSIGLDPLIAGNPGQHDDLYPWYYNEVYDFQNHMWMYNDPNVLIDADTALHWGDTPELCISVVCASGVRITFTDYLVGVYPDHTGVRISDLFPDAQNVNFEWSFVQGQWNDNTLTSSNFAANDTDPALGSDGAIIFDGFFGSDPTVLSAYSKPNDTPEPISVSMFAAGLIGLFGFARSPTRKRPNAKRGVSRQ